MARYKLILAYDGTEFAGSQRQAKSRTVQGELEKALRKLGWFGRSVIMAGRTDAGVHATGQVAAFDLDWVHAIDELQRALNAELPPDLAIKGICEAPAGFHPRFNAASRRYVYRLFCQSVRDPLRERFTWRVWPEVGGETLAKIAALFIGSHDFSVFGSPTTPKGTTARTVIKAEWKRLALPAAGWGSFDEPAKVEGEGLDLDHEWQFEIQADAFLYRMVRRMVFVQVAVAQGKCSVEQVRDALSEQSTLPAGLAPAHGLTLVEVTYGSKLD
jgi:tRNA pseudouridine38-40 synthase